MARCLGYKCAMSNVPKDLSPVLREIDDALKAEGVPPHARPIRAIIEFGKRFNVSLPITKEIHPSAPEELLSSVTYSRQIHEWFEEFYGDRLNFDPSANAKVAIYADGDIWEGPLPILFNALVAPGRQMWYKSSPDTRPPPVYNPCEHLRGITQARLNHFSDSDLNEVVTMYNLGWNAREAFKRFSRHDVLFERAESDWAAATLHLTAQKPDFGQSLYSSLQLAEKFMKALIGQIGEGNPKQRHSIPNLFNELKKSVLGLDELSPLLNALPDKSSARYEYSSNLSEAYAAHKASLELVGRLGTVGYPDYHRRKSERS